MKVKKYLPRLRTEEQIWKMSEKDTDKISKSLNGIF